MGRRRLRCDGQLYTRVGEATVNVVRHSLSPPPAPCPAPQTHTHSQVVSHLSSYLDVPLRYPLSLRGSRSVVFDAHPPLGLGGSWWVLPLSCDSPCQGWGRASQVCGGSGDCFRTFTWLITLANWWSFSCCCRWRAGWGGKRARQRLTRRVGGGRCLGAAARAGVAAAALAVIAALALRAPSRWSTRCTATPIGSGRGLRVGGLDETAGSEAHLRLPCTASARLLHSDLTAGMYQLLCAVLCCTALQWACSCSTRTSSSCCKRTVLAQRGPTKSCRASTSCCSQRGRPCLSSRQAVAAAAAVACLRHRPRCQQDGRGDEMPAGAAPHAVTAAAQRAAMPATCAHPACPRQFPRLSMPCNGSTPALHEHTPTAC